MDYRLGNSKYIKSRGDTLVTFCPNCRNKVNFGVFSTYDTRLIPEFPLVESKNVFFLVCPECAHVFTVDEKLGKDFKNGNKFAITDTDLKPLKAFKGENNDE